MQTTPRCFALVTLVLVAAPLAQAHPGHEGHELTWDFGHLAAHPGATIMCFAVLGAAVLGIWQATRPGGLLRRAVVKHDKGR